MGLGGVAERENEASKEGCVLVRLSAGLPASSGGRGVSEDGKGEGGTGSNIDSEKAKS